MIFLVRMKIAKMGKKTEKWAKNQRKKSQNGIEEHFFSRNRLKNTTRMSMFQWHKNTQKRIVFLVKCHRKKGQKMHMYGNSK